MTWLDSLFNRGPTGPTGPTGPGGPASAISYSDTVQPALSAATVQAAIDALKNVGPVSGAKLTVYAPTVTPFSTNTPATIASLAVADDVASTWELLIQAEATAAGASDMAWWTYRVNVARHTTTYTQTASSPKKVDSDATAGASSWPDPTFAIATGTLTVTWGGVAATAIKVAVFPQLTSVDKT